MTADGARAEEPHAVAYHPEHAIPNDDLSEDSESEEARQRRLRMFGLLLTIIAGIIVLLLTQCTGDTFDTDTDATRTIGAAEGEMPIGGSISVWLKPDQRIATVLRSARLPVNGIIDMGSGRYVLGVLEGTEERSVEALKALPGVSDAGYVYPDRTPLEGESTSSP